MPKILDVSDTHTDDSSKFEYVVNVANDEHVDAVIHKGDVRGRSEVRAYAQVHHEGVARFLGWLPSEHRRIVIVGIEVGQQGGIERVKALSEEDDAFKVLAGRYDHCQSQIQSLNRRYKSLSEFNDGWIKRSLEKTSKELDEERFYVCARLDNVFSECRCPVYLVDGNWDTDRFMKFKWKHLKFLNGVVNVKGINVAGAGNWNETVSPIPDSDYTLREKDLMFGGNQSEAGREFESWLDEKGTDEENEAWFNQGVIPQRILSDNSVFSRLKGKRIDYLACHKGPHILSTEKKIIKKKETLVNYGSGIGLEAIISSKKPKIITAGHIHGKCRVGRYGDHYQYIGTSDQVFTVADIDAVTKQIVPNGVKIFRFAA
ncbi:Calcineurin-like phosphoesterase superfamily domain protein [uncultured archaeon]|nr:Calcineurin-like phosphoesterase superfamily domain protein [uncultured archaeon]